MLLRQGETVVFGRVSGEVYGLGDGRACLVHCSALYLAICMTSARLPRFEVPSSVRSYACTKWAIIATDSQANVTASEIPATLAAQTTRGSDVETL